MCLFFCYLDNILNTYYLNDFIIIIIGINVNNIDKQKLTVKQQNLYEFAEKHGGTITYTGQSNIGMSFKTPEDFQEFVKALNDLVLDRYKSFQELLTSFTID